MSYRSPAVVAAMQPSPCLESLERRVLFSSTVWPSLPNGDLDPDAGVIDVVREYGIDNTDSGDDTALIQQAIRDHVGSSRVLWFRDGTYVISDTLDWKDNTNQFRSRLTIQGESEANTVFVVPDNTPGFENSKSVFRTNSANPEAANGGGNQAFRNEILDLTIDVGNNAGAIGIDYVVSNYGSIENVTVRSDPGAGNTGIRMDREWPGPGLIQDVTIDGFDYGMTMRFHAQLSMTVEDLTLRNQAERGILLFRNSLYLNRLTSENTVPAIELQDQFGHVVLINSSLTGGDANADAIISGGKVYVRDTVVEGYGSAIEDTRPANADVPMNGQGSTTIDEYYTDAVERAFVDAPDSAIGLPVEDMPDIDLGDPNAWANIRDFGATRNGTSDNDRAGIQAALDSGARVVFIPAGQYTTSDTLVVPEHVEYIVSANAFIDQWGSAFNSQNSPRPIFRIEGETSNPLIIEGLHVGGSFGSGTLAVEHASTRTLGLKRSEFSSNDEGLGYMNTVEGGKLFLEDVILPRIRVYGDQSVWARQLNAEFGEAPQIFNDGGRVWVLGMKTEGTMTIAETRGGGQTEILGAFIYPTRNDAPADRPLFRVVDGSLSATYATNQFDYPIHLEETRNGVTEQVTTGEVSGRGAGLLSAGGAAIAGRSAVLTDDAYVRGGDFAGTNFGDDTSLTIKDVLANSFDRTSYLRFEVGATQLSHALLRLTPVSITGDARGESFRVQLLDDASDSWSEGTITGNTAAGFTAIGPALDFSGNDVDVDLPMFFDVTDLLNQSGNANGVATFRVEMIGETGNDPRLQFASKEREEAVFHPELTVSLAGDYNGNGQVEQGDLDLVLQNWGAGVSVPGGINGWVNDAAGIAIVDQDELDRVLQNWGQQVSVAVPERHTVLALTEPVSATDSSLTFSDSPASMLAATTRRGLHAVSPPPRVQTLSGPATIRASSDPTSLPRPSRIAVEPNATLFQEEAQTQDDRTRREVSHRHRRMTWALYPGPTQRPGALSPTVRGDGFDPWDWKNGSDPR